MSNLPSDPKDPPDPFGDKMFFSDEIGDVLGSRFTPGSHEHSFIAGRSFMPSADIHETDGGIVITLEVPGMERDEMDIEIKPGRLTVEGSRIFDSAPLEREHITLERGFGSFKRVFELPGDSDLENVDANLENGLLTITVPEKRVRKNIEASSD